MRLDLEDKKWLEETIEKKVIAGVTQVIEERVEPALDDLRGRVVGVENRLDGVENRLDGVEMKIEDMRADLKNDIARVERKLDNVTDHQAEELDECKKRISRLELATA